MVSEGILDLDRQVREHDDVGHTPALFDGDHNRPTAVPASDLAGYVAVLVPNFLVAVQLHFHHPFLDLLVLSVVYCLCQLISELPRLYRIPTCVFSGLLGDYWVIILEASNALGLKQVGKMPKKRPLAEMSIVELFCDARNNLMKAFLSKEEAQYVASIQEVLRRLTGQSEWTPGQCSTFYKSVLQTFIHDPRELQFILEISGFYKGFETKRLLKDRRVLFATSDLRDDPLFESWEETNSDSRERDIIASAVASLEHALEHETHHIDYETGEIHEDSLLQKAHAYTSVHNVVSKHSLLEGQNRPSVSSMCISHLPQRVKAFIGRTDALKTLKANYDNGERLQIISGSVGVGKTQLALHYCHENASEYDIIEFIDATNNDSLVRSCSDILGSIINDLKVLNLTREISILTEKLDRIAFDCSSPANTARSFVSFFSNIGLRWMLIFDNCNYGTPEECSNLNQFMPESASGDILITTQLSLPYNGIEPVKIYVFSDQEATEFMYQRTKMIVDSSGEDIISILGRHPLALEYACAYIFRTKMSYQDYFWLILGDRQLTSILEQKSLVLTSYETTIADAFRLTIRQIIAESRTNKDMVRVLHVLRFCAFFDVKNFSLSFFQRNSLSLKEPFCRYFYDTSSTNQTLFALTKYSIFQDEGDGTVSIHPLILKYIAKEMTIEQMASYYSILGYHKNVFINPDFRYPELLDAKAHVVDIAPWMFKKVFTDDVFADAKRFIMTVIGFQLWQASNNYLCNQFFVDRMVTIGKKVPRSLVVFHDPGSYVTFTFQKWDDYQLTPEESLLARFKTYLVNMGMILWETPLDLFSPQNGFFLDSCLGKVKAYGSDYMYAMSLYSDFLNDPSLALAHAIQSFCFIIDCILPEVELSSRTHRFVNRFVGVFTSRDWIRFDDVRYMISKLKDLNASNKPNTIKWSFEPLLDNISGYESFLMERNNREERNLVDQEYDTDDAEMQFVQTLKHLDNRVFYDPSTPYYYELDQQLSPYHEYWKSRTSKRRRPDKKSFSDSQND